MYFGLFTIVISYVSIGVRSDGEGCMVFDVAFMPDHPDLSGWYSRQDSHTTCNSYPLYYRETVAYSNWIYFRPASQEWVLTDEKPCDGQDPETLVSADGNGTHLLEDVTGPWVWNSQLDVEVIITCEDTGCPELVVDPEYTHGPSSVCTHQYWVTELCYGRPIYECDRGNYLSYHISQSGWQGWVESYLPCDGYPQSAISAAASYAYTPGDVSSVWEVYNEAENDWRYKSEYKVVCYDQLEPPESGVASNCDTYKVATYVLASFLGHILIGAGVALAVMLCKYTVVRKHKHNPVNIRLQLPDTHMEQPPVAATYGDYSTASHHPPPEYHPPVGSQPPVSNTYMEQPTAPPEYSSVVDKPVF